MKERIPFFLLILCLFIFRTIYGLFSEFWFDDELQIYLIGLKSFTTQTWPFYGPDLVYTSSQIPGALQGLLVSAPWYLLPIPEAPAIFLNILSFLSLSMLARFITFRIPIISKWVVWILVMTTPWVMVYSTRVVNPSYVLVFSIPFFLSIVELLSIYKKPFLNKGLAFFILGITTTLIMQLHMSWVLMMPFIALVVIHYIKSNPRKLFAFSAFFLIGLLIGLSTLIPTWINPSINSPSINSNIVFNLSNFKNIIIILLRYLSFAGFEISYMLGGSFAARMAVLMHQLWMFPFAIFLLVVGFAQVVLFVIAFFYNKGTEEWRKIKWLTFTGYVLIFLSFFFSIKGPSSHTFYLMLPIPMLYSFYCYQWLILKNNRWAKWIKIAVICGLFFHLGLAIDNFQNRSMYKNRKLIEEAIKKKDYQILGTRRADIWGYGY